MSSFFTILWINSSLLIGYSIKLLSQNKYYVFANYLLTITLYGILFVTGVSITTIDNLGSEIYKIFCYAGLVLGITLILNTIVMVFYDRLTQPKVLKREVKFSFRWKVIWVSLTQIMWVGLGSVFGFLFPHILPHTDMLGNVLLTLMLFIIGLQLRSSGVQLRDFLLNRKGLQISILFMVSCWVAALLVSFALSLPVSESLAINSGFGWYSMSGGLVTKLYGPFWGAVALINDLGRELIALTLIPILMKFSPAASIAISGSTKFGLYATCY